MSGDFTVVPDSAAQPADCYQRAEPGEPRFTLLGRDPSAAALVHLWTVMRCMGPRAAESAEKIDDANRIASEMAEWLQKHRPDRQVDSIATLARAVAALAELTGAVITIEQQSTPPLAMGNYRHVVSVRAKR